MSFPPRRARRGLCFGSFEAERAAKLRRRSVQRSLAQASQRKKEVAMRLPELFGRKSTGSPEVMKELFEEIGRLNLDLEWLKKRFEAGALRRAVS